MNVIVKKNLILEANNTPHSIHVIYAIHSPASICV